MSNYIKHHGVKGMKWGVRRYQNKNGSLTPAGKKRYNDDEYDEEREALEKENARRAGVKYVRKTKKEREAEDAENERIFNARLEKDTAAQKRTEDRMKEIDKKLQAKYDLSSMEDLDKYYKEYDEAWFEVLAEERKKEGLSHADLFALDELYHHGIKGMKWGVRRFQKKDGTLTSAGKQRYSGNDSNDAKDGPTPEQLKKMQEAEATFKKLKFQNDVKVAKGLYDKYAPGIREKAKEADTKEYNKKLKEDLSKMSDKELQAIVNRLNMEERYTQVMNSRYVKEGKSVTDKILDTAGTIVTIGTTAVSLMTMIDKMQKKN